LKAAYLETVNFAAFVRVILINFLLLFTKWVILDIL